MASDERLEIFLYDYLQAKFDLKTRKSPTRFF